MTVKLFTIGFTKTTADSFFGRLKAAGVRKVVDVRLNNRSQLAGFAKQNDLRYFLRELGDIEYEHRPDLAPTKELLDGYRKLGGGWTEYEAQFLRLMEHRKIEKETSPESLHFSCLLCSEAKPLHCHRRLVAEYLDGRWEQVVDVVHL